jgi:predicted O-methyltransferase YrrM
MTMDTKRGPIARLPGRLRHMVGALARRSDLVSLANASASARAVLAVTTDSFAARERAVLNEIEGLYRRLCGRDDMIEISIDVMDIADETVSVGQWAERSSIMPLWGRLLYALAREVKPRVCIELGAAVGVSGLYIQAGMREAGQGTFVTIEGAAASAAIAEQVYCELGFDGTVVVGTFDDNLRPTLERVGTVDLAFVDGHHRAEPTLRYDREIRSHSHPGTVIVYDDIHWSREMEIAWERIQDHDHHTVIDTYRFGLAEIGERSSGTGNVPAWVGFARFG